MTTKTITPQEAANYFKIQELNNQVRNIPWAIKPALDYPTKRKKCRQRNKDKASKLARRRNR
jgi:hypothetical protein